MGEDKKQDKKGEIKVIARNKSAFHEYEILDHYEAGMALTGSEIKSVRAGGMSLKEGYVRIKEGEAWLLDTHISPYRNAAAGKADKPFRPRKLLLHRRELDSIIGRVQRKGLTIVPLQAYIKNNYAKLEIGLARNKKQFDKRQDIIKRETERELDRRVKDKKLRRE
jgi:SsrA-binding protein